MAVTEAAKHDLYTYLQETMGDQRADTLMAMVSPTGWEDVATKQDLEHLRAATKQDLILLRTEMADEFKLVRTEMADEFKLVRTEMADEFKLVRTEMADEFKLVRTEMAALQSDLKATLYRTLRTHTMAMFGLYGIFMSLAVTLVR